MERILNFVYGDSEEIFLNRLSVLMLLSGGFTLATLISTGMRAMYGRYSVDSKLSIPGRLAWFFQEAPSFFISLSYLAKCTDKVNALILSLFIFHYFVRTFIFPFLMKSSKPTPWFIFLSAFVFCVWNGYLQGAYLSKVAQYPHNHLHTMQTLLGVFLFLTGFAINQHSDHILRNLRQPGETAYKIPKGGLFEFVSGANFFGEIVEWIGFALVSNTLPGYAFAFFTAANIGPRALQHHNWYLSKFDDYPKSRKALIPFIL